MINKIDSSLASLLNTGADKPTPFSANKKSDPFTALNMDKLGLSKDAQKKVLYARAQFEVNFQAIKEVSSSQGYEMAEMSFSFKNSFEFLSEVSGQGKEVAVESDENDQLAKLQDYFSPENTAKRILDFALSFYPKSRFAENGDNQQAREKFAGFIGSAIDTGFSKARETLGELPSEISDNIDKTHSIIFSGLDNFVKNGISPEQQQPGGIFERIQAYRYEMSQTTQIISKSNVAGYTTKGVAQTNQPEPSISKKG